MDCRKKSSKFLWVFLNFYIHSRVLSDRAYAHEKYFRLTNSFQINHRAKKHIFSGKLRKLC